MNSKKFSFLDNDTFSPDDNQTQAGNSKAPKYPLTELQQMFSDKYGPRGHAEIDPEIFATPVNAGFTTDEMRNKTMSPIKVNVSNKRRQAPLPEGYELDRNSDTLLIIGNECVPSHYEDLKNVLVMQDDSSVLPALELAYRNGVLVRNDGRRSRPVQLDLPVLNIEWNDDLNLDQFVDGTRFYATDEYVIDIVAQRFKTSLVCSSSCGTNVYDVTYNREVKPVVDCKVIVIGDYEYLQEIDGRDGAYIYDSICEEDETTRHITDVTELEGIPTRASVNVFVSSDTMNMNEVFNLLKLPKLRKAVIYYYNVGDNAQYRLTL